MKNKSLLEKMGYIDTKYVENAVYPQKKKVRTFRRGFVAAACCALVITAAGGAYAADVGGIQRAVQLWIYGDKTNATITFDKDENSSSYSIQYKDEDGKTHERGGGGVAINDDGTERPLTEDEMMEQINAPEVIYNDDATVMLYYLDKELDITDKFNDGVCYVKLEGDDETLYLTIKYNNGYAYSKNKYVMPYEFN